MNTAQPRQKNKRKPIIQIWLEEDIFEEAKALAEQEVRSLSVMGRILLTEALEARKAKIGELDEN